MSHSDARCVYFLLVLVSQRLNVFVVIDDQAQEKYDILEALGATVEKVRPVSIVDKDHFVNVARRRASELNGDENGFFCDQFENLANFKAHYSTTGPEIYAQTNGKINAIVLGAGK